MTCRKNECGTIHDAIPPSCSCGSFDAGNGATGQECTIGRNLTRFEMVEI